MPYFTGGANIITEVDNLEIVLYGTLRKTKSLTILNRGATSTEAAALAAAVAELSNAGLVEYTFAGTRTYVEFGDVTVWDEVYDENTRAVFLFQDNTNVGNPEVRFSVPGPDAGIFQAGTLLVDPTNARMVTFIAAALAYLNFVPLTNAYAFKGGYRRGAKASARRAAPTIVDPSGDAGSPAT